MRYREAISYLNTFTNYEKVPGLRHDDGLEGLDRVRLLMRLLGRPQNAFNSVVVAGTKGKGSVCAMLDSVLRRAGHIIGLYTSPHLHTYRERIRVGGILISPADVARLTEQIQPVVERIRNLGEPTLIPTLYELTTAIGFLYFQEKGVEIAILEVGLGGRLDAVNVVAPLVSVITPISLDHMQVLGNTVGEIAQEKAGIIKDDVVVVTAPQPPEAMVVVTTTAERHGSEIITVGKDVFISAKHLPELVSDSDGVPMRQAFDIGIRVPGESTEINLRVRTPLLGSHQQINACVALATLRVLLAMGVPIRRTALLEGFQNVEWPGRLEVINRKPLVIGDGAHNPASMAVLKQAIAELFQKRQLVVVLGMSSDKDIESFVAELHSWSGTLLGLNIERVIVGSSRHPRSADPRIVAAAVQKRNLECEIAESLDEALARAEDIAWRLPPGDDGAALVLVTGSLFVVAEAREYFGLAPDLSEED